MLKQEANNIAIYLRLSHDDGDEESESIQNQRKLIHDYINKNFNFNNYYEYVDDGYSGSNFNRPAFKKMINELQLKQIDLVITKNLARFGRNYIDSGEYIEKVFPNQGIRYIAILDGVDNFEDKVQNSFAPFKGLFNELHCRETSKALKKTKRKKMEEGYYYCPIPPYGYKHDPENHGRLIVDEEPANVVKRIFLMKHEGMTAKQIAETLNKEKIITPSRYMGIFKNRKIDIWTGDGVARLLSKAVYVGDTCVGKDAKVSYKNKKVVRKAKEEWYITKDTHEAIISREIFDEIHNNKKYNNKKRRNPNVDTPLGDFIYCNYCGRKMGKFNKNGKIVLSCSAYRSSNELCQNSKRYKYSEIEKIVLEDLKINLNEFLEKQQSRKNVYGKYKKQNIKEYENEKKQIDNAKRKILFEISELYNKRLDGSIKEEVYIENYKILTNRRAELDKQLKGIEENRMLPDKELELKEKMKKARKIYKNLSVDKFTKNDMTFLIDKINIDQDILEIQYKFKE